MDIGNDCQACPALRRRPAAEINTGNLVRKSKPRWYVAGDRGTLIKEGLDPQEPAMLAGNIDAAQENPANRARVYTDFAGLSSEVVVERLPARPGSPTTATSPTSSTTASSSPSPPKVCAAPSRCLMRRWSRCGRGAASSPLHPPDPSSRLAESPPCPAMFGGDAKTRFMKAMPR